MTDLQVSLIAVGGAFLLGVIAYNQWQEYKARKSVERAFSSSHDDVLMTDNAASSSDHQERRDPTFSPTEYERQADSASYESRHAEDAVAFSTESQNPILSLDELVDCIIPLIPDGAVYAEKLLPMIQTLRHVGNKPVHFLGQREDGVWESITHGGVYFALQAGIQLANRHTALNELEYSEFITRLRQIADQLETEPAIPDMIVVMQAARDLHQFIGQYDAQLSVNVLSNGAPWAISTLLGALERQGFDLRPDGRLVMSDGEGGILFSLSTNVTLAEETTPLLTLLLDVPRVGALNDGFGAMTSCAKMLATRLDGKVVDDSRQMLSAEALGEIASQVTTFYQQMEAASIAAGSTRALRLFS